MSDERAGPKKVRRRSRVLDLPPIVEKMRANAIVENPTDELSLRQIFLRPEMVALVREMCENGFTCRQIAERFPEAGLSGTFGSIYEGVRVARKAGARRNGAHRVGKNRRRRSANPANGAEASDAAVFIADEHVDAPAQAAAPKTSATAAESAPAAAIPQKPAPRTRLDDSADIDAAKGPDIGLVSRTKPTISPPKKSNTTYSVPDIARTRNDNL